jgi:hypothetical protein
MSQNLAQVHLTEQDLATMREGLAMIRSVIASRATSLTPQQRKSLVKMGDKSRNFCGQAVAGLQSNGDSLPKTFNVEALAVDLADFTALDAFHAEFEQVGEMIDDTTKALSSDVMVNALVGVSFLKALNKLNPSLDKLLQQLGAIRRAKPAAKKQTGN